MGWRDLAAVLLVVAAAAAGARADDAEASAGAGVRELEQALADQANSAMDSVVNSVGRYVKLGNTMKWEDGLKHCENEPGRRLCTYKEYCPFGPGKKVAGGGQLGDQWAPVNDYHNEWVQIGSDSARVCRTHTELHKQTPAWGDNSANALKFRGNAMCCKSTFDKMDETYPTWEQANAHCANKNKRLCRRDEYCPEGGGKSPRGGTMYNGVWGAVFDNDNEWVAIGYTFPLRHLCKTHTEIAGVKASWGTTNKKNTRRGLVRCCADTFDNIAGKMTWSSAATYCKEKGKRLCRREEYCPEGAKKPPRGGLRPGEAWSPVSDSENEWVSVGVTNPGRQCKLHTEALDSKPTWGESTGWRGHIMCCDGGGGGGGGGESEASSEQSDGAEESASEEAATAAAAEESSEEGSEESSVNLEDVDLQKAEQSVKARESEQNAKAASTEQAAKRRQAAEEVEKANQMKKGLADEEGRKRGQEEMMKHADGIKEAAAKRAAGIMEEARKKAGQHSKSEETEKDPATVWVNLPKQAELMGPGETANSLNRIEQ